MQTLSIDRETSDRMRGWRKSDILETLKSGSLATVTVAELEPHDVARGVHHSQMITGAPVAITSVKYIGRGKYRVGYTIIGRWSHGWRDLDGSRRVTLDPKSGRARA